VTCTDHYVANFDESHLAHLAEDSGTIVDVDERRLSGPPHHRDEGFIRQFASLIPPMKG
jgi:hypothetical protein